MTENIENLVLEHVQAIRADLRDVKDRLTNVEIQQSLMGQQLGALTTAFYTSQSRLDKIEHRLERIEQRLDLIDAST